MSASLAVAAVLTLLAAPIFAQTPPAQPPPAEPKPAAPQPAPAQPPRPFPEGSKLAWIDIQRIANDSAEGKTSTAKVQALTQKKGGELNEKNKQLQANQQKLQQGGTVLSDTARAQLEKEIEKLQVDIQRFQQDAQAEVQELQQDLQADFQRKLFPIIQQVVAEKGLHVLFSRGDAGMVWADPGLDITAEVIKRFDAAHPAAAPQAAPAAKPPAKPPQR